MALSFQNWLRSAHVAPLPKVLKRYEAGVSLQQSWMKVGKRVQFNEDDVFYSNFIKCWAFVYLFFAWWGAEVPKFKGDNLLLTWVWQRPNETDVGDVDQLVMVEFLTGKLFQFAKVDSRRQSWK